MDKDDEVTFVRGDKVVCDGYVYDFGYISGTGHAVLYKEGECNMQDAIAVDPKKFKIIKYKESNGIHNRQKRRSDKNQLHQVRSRRQSHLQ